MSLQTFLLALSVFVTVIAPITYIISIIKGKTKPHRMTRFILTFVLTLNLVSIVAAHGNLGAISLACIFFLQAIVIFLLSLWHGMGGSNVLDWVCLVVAFLGIIGWKLTGNPLLGVYFSILADFSGFIPAFIKTWKYPHTESHWFYSLGAIGAFLTLIAYGVNMASLFQIYIAIACTVMVGFIFRKKIQVLFR